MSNESKSFADLGVSNTVVAALAKRGISEPFAVQRMVVEDVLDGADVLVKSPTGSGKTLAFAIPLVERIEADGPRPAALILAPTRELACQIVEEMRSVAHARALRVSPVYGGVGIAKQSEIAARSHIIVATPGRLEDLLQRGAFTLARVETLVLDEADRMLDMGFKPAVDRIVAACPQDRQTLFFSATLDGLAGQIARRYTRDAIVHEHAPPSSRATTAIEHRFVQVGSEDRVQKLVGELSRERDLALVFVRTKRGADRLVKRLAGSGVTAAAIHGNKSQRQREQALARFQSGTIDTLVATDVAARGIDIDRISHVINFDLPEDHSTYTHRVGRTGRAGRTGVGITFVANGQGQAARQIASRLDLPDDGASRTEHRRDPRPAAGENGRSHRSGTAERSRRRRRAPAGR